LTHTGVIPAKVIFIDPRQRTGIQDRVNQQNVTRFQQAPDERPDSRRSESKQRKKIRRTSGNAGNRIPSDRRTIQMKSG
jgi:hypothetical protein